jgi:plasmid stability protein
MHICFDCAYICYFGDVRTTLNLDDDLFQQLRVEASQRGRTLTSLLEDAVRAYLAATKERAANDLVPVRLTTVAGRGTLPGVDLDNSAALADVMDRADSTARR